MPTPIASIEEAKALGYVPIYATLPSGANLRDLTYLVTLEGKIAGETDKSAHLVRHVGQSMLSREDAEAKALADLNAWRDNRYGHAPEGGSVDHAGVPLEVDVS
jgi:hypothetical protein